MLYYHGCAQRISQRHMQCYSINRPLSSHFQICRYGTMFIQLFSKNWVTGLTEGDNITGIQWHGISLLLPWIDIKQADLSAKKTLR